MLEYFTVENVNEMRHCYGRDRINELFAGRERITFLEALDLPIPPADMVWLFTRPGVLRHDQLVEFACRAAERALERNRQAGRELNEDSVQAIQAARKFIRGEIESAGLHAACHAVGDSACGPADFAATNAASVAAYDPVFDGQFALRAAESAALRYEPVFGGQFALRAAELAAMRNALATQERRLQIADLRELIEASQP